MYPALELEDLLALRGPAVGLEAADPEARADLERVLSPELFSQRLARLRAVAATAAGDGTNQSAAETARLARKPRIEFDGTQKKKGAGGDKQSEAQKYLETLQKSGEQVQKLTDYEKALNEIQAKRLKGMGSAKYQNDGDPATSGPVYWHFSSWPMALRVRTADMPAVM